MKASGITVKNRIRSIIKYMPGVYTLYFYIMSALINSLKLLIHIDDQMIMFNSFAGRKFDDSPKAIYDLMKSDLRFSNYKLIWALDRPQDYELGNTTVIKTDTLKYFIMCLKSRVWITNSSFERGLRFKNNKTFYFNTWHGTPLKKMGSDIGDSNQSFSSKSGTKWNAMTSQSEFETDIFSRAFNIPRDNILEFGLPRNDILSNYGTKDRQHLRRSLGIEDDKIVILYAPTFREYEKEINHGIVLAPPINFNHWREVLGESYTIMFRAHYEVAKIMNFNESDYVKNMTSYPSINDLIIASDILITDYSSILFDYSITGKPILHFTYDYEKYIKNRGVYFDIRKYFDGAANEDQLLRIIKNLNTSKAKKQTIDFREKFLNFYGTATEKVIDYIAKELGISETSHP